MNARRSTPTPFDAFVVRRQHKFLSLPRFEFDWRLPWFLPVSAAIGLSLIAGAVAMLRLSSLAYRAVPPLDAEKTPSRQLPYQQPVAQVRGVQPVQPTTPQTPPPIFDTSAPTAVSNPVEAPKVVRSNALSPRRRISRRTIVRAPAATSTLAPTAPSITRAPATAASTDVVTEERYEDYEAPGRAERHPQEQYPQEQYPAAATPPAPAAPPHGAIDNEMTPTEPANQYPPSHDADRYPLSPQATSNSSLPPVSMPRADHPIWQDESDPPFPVEEPDDD
ncbi:MAG: hypothetical protein M3347_12985 [Armatimonadota bacterium]|nr:hypothetical protein [Armatimonadota bacterium]